jgi:hypothetical protein
MSTRTLPSHADIRLMRRIYPERCGYHVPPTMNVAQILTRLSRYVRTVRSVPELQGYTKLEIWWKTPRRDRRTAP